MTTASTNETASGMQNVGKLTDRLSNTNHGAWKVSDWSQDSTLASGQSAEKDCPQVLFVIDQLCEIGGAEHSLLLTIRTLQQKGMRCSVATFRMDPSLEIFQNFPCHLHLFPLRRTYDWNALRMALRFRRLIRSAGIRVVHTFFETSDIWGGVVAKLSGCPVLVSSRRDMGILRAQKHRMAYRLVGPLFDRVTAVSEEVRAFCIQQDSLSPKKVVTLYNGIDLKKVAAARNGTELRAAEDLIGISPVIITVAHLRRVKGIDILLNAAARVCREFPKANFLVVGKVLEPQYARELQHQTRALGLTDRVRFLGGRSDVLSLLKMSDIFCLPSRSEGFSNALLEAMACGLPCVATRVGGNAEAIQEGCNGFLVDSQDAELIADRILWLARNPEGARQMGTASREIVQRKFTIEAQTEQLIHLYQRLLEGKRS